MSKATVSSLPTAERELPPRQVISERTDAIQRELIRIAGQLRVAAGALCALDEASPGLKNAAGDFSILDVQSVVEAAATACDLQAEAADSVTLFRPEP